MSRKENRKQLFNENDDNVTKRKRNGTTKIKQFNGEKDDESQTTHTTKKKTETRHVS